METHSKKAASSGPGRVTGSDPMAKITEHVDDASERVEAAVADVGRKAADTLEAQRGPAAVILEHTASVLHDKAANVADAADAAADTLDATADYVRKHNIKRMAKDVTDLVRRHPGASLAVAGAAGFLIARVFRSRD